MSINFNEGKIECDECGESEIFTGCVHYKEFVEETKQNGWTAQQVEETWINKCPHCSQ